jgi:4-nitrophenyl phosphatase
MDGVLWRADTPIGNLPGIFDRIKERGLKVAFATNNGTRTPEQYVERLANFGVLAEPWQVITSGLGVAYLLEKRLPPMNPIYVVGEKGVSDILKEKGYELVSVDEADRAKAVVMGIDRQINFEKMSMAGLLVRRGIPFYATNPDKTFPTPRGEIPGAGAWISVVITASGVQPIYAGKPSPYMLELARERLCTEKRDTLVIGDRLETDIQGGQAAGMPVALVLSGVSNREDGENWRPAVDLIAGDLNELVQ